MQNQAAVIEDHGLCVLGPVLLDTLGLSSNKLELLANTVIVYADSLCCIVVTSLLQRTERLAPGVAVV